VLTTRNPLYPKIPGTLNFGAGKFGVLLTVKAAATGAVAVYGSWAVTAP
jgi:hypothetical protein